MNAEQQTLGEEIFGWIEANGRVTEDALVGHPIELMEWQKREIVRIRDDAPSDHFGRSQMGKTTFGRSSGQVSGEQGRDL